MGAVLGMAEAVIGIDVEPAPEEQDEADAPATGFPPGARTRRRRCEVARAVLRHYSGRIGPVARKQLKRFEAVDLHLGTWNSG